MSISRRNRWIALIGLTWMLLVSCGVSTAAEVDTRLRKRITELEAENRALRKIISEIQSALKNVPESTSPNPAESGALRIVVVPGDWGGSGLVDMRKVCESAAGTIAVQLVDDGFAPILVHRSMSGPITYYRRGEGNEHLVHLDTGGRAWAQLAFQFSHEFCHIVCNYRDARNPQKWFEETLCETASLYALRQMAVEWKTNPPYSNWKSYSTSLAGYADDRIRMHTGPEGSLAEVYRANLTALEKTGTNRKLNTNIAVRLLPLFEATPAAWQTLRYLNLGPAEENAAFKSYLAGWHRRVPEQHQPFVRRVAVEFGIELQEEPPTD